jgi:hypothetical protein
VSADPAPDSAFLPKTHFPESEAMILLKQPSLLIKGMIHESFANLRSRMAFIPGFRNAHTQQKEKTPTGLICTAMTKRRQNTGLSLSGQTHGLRAFAGSETALTTI